MSKLVLSPNKKTLKRLLHAPCLRAAGRAAPDKTTATRHSAWNRGARLANKKVSIFGPPILQCRTCAKPPILANLKNQRAANQIFPFLMLPQFFLAGVFNPIRVLPWYLDILSRLSPMRYAVDVTRNVFYAGQPEHAKVVLQSPVSNLTIIAVAFGVFLVVGTFLFVRSERNR